MGGIRACIAWLHPELQHHGSLYRKEVAHGGDSYRACVYDQIREFARARNVRCVVLFGSRARGTNLPKSDIDLAFSGGDAVGFEEDIQERLWSLLKADIINLDEPISSELRHEIDRDGRVLYEAL